MTERGCAGGVRTRARARDSRGAVALEFAVVVPILAMLLLGIVTTGYSYSHVLGLTNAVREGARFGATTNATSASWASDVITRVRQTQFDDQGSPPETAICVQLWQSGSGPLITRCDQGNGSVLQPGGLSMPLDTDPKRGVPGGLTSQQCVVRVIGARNYSVNFILAPPINAAFVSYSVNRYERMDAYPTCK